MQSKKIMPNAQLMVTHDIRRLYQSVIIQSKLNASFLCISLLNKTQIPSKITGITVVLNFLCSAWLSTSDTVHAHIKQGFFHVLYDSSHQNVPYMYSTAVISKTIEHC